MKIIDAHLHYSSHPGFTETAAAAGHENSAAHLSALFRECGIVGAVAMGAGAHWPVPEGVSAPMVPDLGGAFCAAPWNQSPEIFFCAGVDHATLTAENLPRSLPYFERLLATSHCVGLKLYPGYHAFQPDDPLYAPFYELAAAYDVPVVFHSGETASSGGRLRFSHPLLVDDVAVKFPETRFVIAHYGNPWVMDATAVLAKNPNVFADLSGLGVGNFSAGWYLDHYRGYIEYLRTWITYLSDYDKLLYGSDWPLVNIPAYLEVIAALIPEAEQEAVFYHNARRVFSKLDI